MRPSRIALPLVLALVVAACAGNAGGAASAPASAGAGATEAGARGGIQLLNRRAGLNTMQTSYPPLLRDARVTGDVVVEVTLDALGRVSGAVVRSSTHPDFYAPGQQVARRLRFTAPAAAGQRVTVRIQFAPLTSADIVITD